MEYYQIPIDSPAELLPVLVFIMILGVIWLVIRSVFKLAMKGFMIGCIAILGLGALAMAVLMLGP